MDHFGMGELYFMHHQVSDEEEGGYVDGGEPRPSGAIPPARMFLGSEPIHVYELFGRKH